MNPVTRRRFLKRFTGATLALPALNLTMRAAAQTGIPRSRLRDVNTTDLRGAIELGCGTMSGIFNADDQYIPFFESRARPDPAFAFNDSFSEAHVPGRHLNALLSAEHAAGLSVSEEAVEKHARAAFFAFDGPVPLPLNRSKIGGPLRRFLPHNVREGFHALYALARFRKSEKARRVMESSIAAVRRLWTPDRGWDRAKLEAQGVELHEWAGPLITGLARAIGPLVKYYRATGYGPALDLALTLSDRVTAECFTAEGSYDTERFGNHTHSTTCVMSSLAQLADLTKDTALMQRVQTFFGNGLGSISNALGWSPENTRPDAPPDLGEGNNSGDILETALILGSWGSDDAWHRAERLLRGHLLPSQLRDVSFITGAPDPQNADARRDVAARHRGAWGFPAPYGHQARGVGHISFNLDIVGGVVGSLCAALQAAASSGPDGHRVSLLFDHESDALRVESPYTRDHLSIQVRRPGPLWVRLPPWVDRASLKRPENGPVPHLRGDWLFFAEPGNAPVTIPFPLKEEELTLTFRDRRIRTRLRGDSVLAMENSGTDLNFFDPL